MSNRRKKRPYNKSMASRINSLEDAIDMLKEALIPTEIKAIFWAPGLPEPDMDNLPKGHTVIRFVSECEIKEVDLAESQKIRDEIESRLAECKAETLVEIIPDPPPEAAQAATASKQETIIEPALGVKWGFAPRASLIDRVRSPHRFTGLARIL